RACSEATRLIVSSTVAATAAGASLAVRGPDGKARACGGGGDSRGDDQTGGLAARRSAQQPGTVGGLHARGFRASGGSQPAGGVFGSDLSAAARFAGSRPQRGLGAAAVARTQALQAL